MCCLPSCLILEHLCQNYGRVFAQPEGTLTSPNYPNAYPDNLNCSWIIEVAAERVLTLKVLVFANEFSPDKLYVSLLFYNSSNRERFILKHNLMKFRKCVCK